MACFIYGYLPDTFYCSDYLLCRATFPTRMPEMQHRFKDVLHFRLPVSPQRYNSLDFPSGNRVPRGTLSPLDISAKGNAVFLGYPMPTGMLSPLLDAPEPRSYAPYIFFAMGTQTMEQSCLTPSLRKTKTRFIFTANLS